MGLLMAGCIFAVSPAQAADFRSGEIINLSSGDAVNGDIYAAANDISVDVNLPGDAFLAAANVRVNGDVAQDLFAAGAMVTVSGYVGDDVRVAGSQVLISGTIEGDLFAAGAMVTVLPGAEIKGDVYSGAGNLVIDGKVAGNVVASGGEVFIRGEIGNSSMLWADSVRVGPDAKIAGRLVYNSVKEASIAESAVIGAGVEYHKIEQPEKTAVHKNGKGSFGAFYLGWFIFKLLCGLASAFVLFYFFKQGLTQIVELSLKNFAGQLGWGFVWLIVAPVACIFLLVTVFGAPLAFMGMLVYAITIMIAKIVSGIVLGVWIMRLIDKKRNWLVDWKAILSGVPLITIIAAIPFFGWVVVFTIFLAALGATINNLKKIAR